jgi:hypothetical protein
MLLTVQAAAEMTPLKLIVPSDASALAERPKDTAITAILVESLLMIISYVINVKFISLSFPAKWGGVKNTPC